jgi:membrane dipeptidase
LKELAKNGGVVGVNFYSGFVTPAAARHTSAIRKELREKHPDPAAFDKAFDAWLDANPIPRATLKQVADQIDHLVKVAGIDHVGLGSDFDGITSTPIGLEDVSTYPRLTDELIRRGYSDDDIKKILGGNFLRVLRQAGEVAAKLQKTTKPEVDSPAVRKKK